MALAFDTSLDIRCSINGSNICSLYRIDIGLQGPVVEQNIALVWVSS